ncbi:MAG: hypothetical protein ACRD0S_06140, partial [Acidimicrobiales bacterium]
MTERLEEAGSVLVANLAVDGADFWVQLDPEVTPADASHGPVRMILSVADPDAAYARAVAAGATIAPVHDGHGWRGGPGGRPERAPLGAGPA